MHSPPLTHTKSSRKTRAQTRADLVPSSNVLPAALPLSVTAKASKPTRQRRQPQRRQLALPTSASNRRPESEESVQSHSSEENSSLTALTESNLRSLGRAAAKDLPVSLKQVGPSSASRQSLIIASLHLSSISLLQRLIVSMVSPVARYPQTSYSSVRPPCCDQPFFLRSGSFPKATIPIPHRRNDASHRQLSSRTPAEIQS